MARWFVCIVFCVGVVACGSEDPAADAGPGGGADAAVNTPDSASPADAAGAPDANTGGGEDATTGGEDASTGGEDAGGNTTLCRQGVLCNCPTGQSCNFTCPGGNCDINCETNSTC